MNEWERIALLGRIFDCAADGVSLGIGDDAAVVGDLVLSVDAAVEHVHFERRWLSMQDLGFKSAMAALSDLAAMGAQPVALLSSLALPGDVDDAMLEALARGQREAADEVGAMIVGGNLSRAGELGIHTTVVGRAPERPITRSGARPGDRILAAGPLGLAAAGLDALRNERDAPPAWIEAWRRPRARIAEGRAAADVATAAIDVSDGLAADLHHLMQASGVGIELDEAALRDDVSMENVLFGGEDYALIVTSSSPVDGFRLIGRCVDGPDLWLKGDGTSTAIGARGWQHFDD